MKERDRASAIEALVAGALAFLFYVATAAPGLSWANHGADGGELLAAAVTNGVPHPPGYPLYMLLLQGWLALTAWLLPGAELAWRGTLFSAFCAAASVGVTVRVAQTLLRTTRHARVWALLAGMAWATSPLLWGQATITEVYGLHGLLLSLLGWWALSQASTLWLIPLTAVGIAHHLTLIFLLPAALYVRWSQRQRTAGDPYQIGWLMRVLVWLLMGGVVGLTLHARTLLVAGQAAPVNWGFAEQLDGLWWLISGQAYRSYLFSASSAVTFDRLAAWAYILTTQFTPVGLALGLVGLSHFDRDAPALRNFGLLWLVPVSIYAIVYYTKDSEIYLLPVIWLLALWVSVGLAMMTQWLREVRKGDATVSIAALVVSGIALLGLTLWRLPNHPPRQDDRAQQFITQVQPILQPGNVVVSRGDERTFALWYAVWASDDLPGDLILVNDSLYQFEWYRRLLQRQYPTVAGADQSIDALLRAQHATRTIYFTEQLATVPAEQLQQAGPLWRYVAPP